MIPALDDESSACLRFIDPYGDTIFNKWQAGPLRRELIAAAETANGIDSEVVQRVAALVERCGEGDGLYVWFIGD